ncbi:MAG: hypothetical protein RR415_07195 [Ruthenibacterium sp.]
MILKIRKIKRKAYIVMIASYILALNFLIKNCYANLFLNVYINPYGLEYRIIKNIIGVFLAGIIGMHTVYQINDKNFSSDIFGIIEILYFIPGILYCTITNTPLLFISFFFAFWLLMTVFNILIPTSKGTLAKYINFYIPDKVFGMCLIAIVILAFITGKLSGANFFNLIFSGEEIYENRANLAARNVHWIIWNLTISLAYFIPVLLCLTIKMRKFFISALLCVAEFYLYSIGSNRIFIYLLGMALFFSFFRANKASVLKTQFAMVIVSIIGFYVNSKLFQIIPSIIDRLGTIPTKVAIRYFMYFSNHEPAYLADAFPRLYNILGIESPFVNNGIGTVVGYYFSHGFDNENTGLVGGGIGNFGMLSILISPIFYILGFRIIESVCNKIQNPTIRFQIALTYAIYAINANQFFTIFIRYSSGLLLLIFILVIINRNHSHTEIEVHIEENSSS